MSHELLDLEEWELVLNKMLKFHFNISEEIKAVVQVHTFQNFWFLIDYVHFIFYPIFCQIKVWKSLKEPSFENTEDMYTSSLKKKLNFQFLFFYSRKSW